MGKPLKKVVKTYENFTKIRPQASEKVEERYGFKQALKK